MKLGIAALLTDASRPVRGEVWGTKDQPRPAYSSEPQEKITKISEKPTHTRRRIYNTNNDCYDMTFTMAVVFAWS